MFGFHFPVLRAVDISAIIEATILTKWNSATTAMGAASLKHARDAISPTRKKVAIEAINPVRRRGLDRKDAMTKEELAAMLNGREIYREITDMEDKQAEKSGLIVFFGASDDLVEIRGKISDELDACDGRDIFMVNGRLIPDLDDETEIEALQKHGVLEIVQEAHKNADKVEALWCEEKGGPSWTFKTAIPHATFDVMENGEVFCRGIVI